MTARFVPWDAKDPLFEQVVRVWAAAFSQPPYCIQNGDRDIRNSLLNVHSRRDGFRGVAAVNDRGLCIGMAYGYRGGRGQWWTDSVSRRLSPQSQERWLKNHYEVVEIAVHPNFQGQGIGAVLVHHLIAGRPEPAVLLSTRTDAAAHHLYRRLGFEVLTEMQFGENQPWYFIMGKALR